MSTGERTRERARYWRHPAEPGVDLLSARYVRHAFGRHSHEQYAIAVVLDGVEEFQYGGSVERAAPGQVALVNPGVVHTGHAGTPGGWTYRVLYPSVAVVAEVAAELGAPAGTPAFTDPVVADPAAARLLLAAHRAAEANGRAGLDDGAVPGNGRPIPGVADPAARPLPAAHQAGDAARREAAIGHDDAVTRGGALASDSLLRLLLASLLRRYGRAPVPDAGPPLAGDEAVARARELLHARMADPPKLDDLAAEVGARPFPLLRAFRAAHGLPPHAYLNQERVRAARRLLDSGTPVAEAACAVGFVDQAHLTRHFRRVLGITPGAYRREGTGQPSV